jgi:hypothetical protein
VERVDDMCTRGRRLNGNYGNVSNNSSMGDNTNPKGRADRMSSMGH